MLEKETKEHRRILQKRYFIGYPTDFSTNVLLHNETCVSEFLFQVTRPGIP